MREKEVQKIYFRELFGALAIYAVILFAAMSFGPGMASGWVRTVVLVSPMAGFLLAVWAVARQFGRIDEYIRQTSLENIALAAAITAGLTFTWGFMENAGYPRLSMFVVWPVMGTSWGMVALVRTWMAR